MNPLPRKTVQQAAAGLIVWLEGNFNIVIDLVSGSSYEDAIDLVSGTTEDDEIFIHTIHQVSGITEDDAILIVNKDANMSKRLFHQ